MSSDSVGYNYLNNTTARVELLGMPNPLNPTCHMDSAARVAMFDDHLRQTMTIDGAEFNRVFTGFERQFVNYEINDSLRDTAVEVLDVIYKYPPSFISGGVVNCPTIYVIVATIDDPSGHSRLDYFTIDRYWMGNNGFGHVPNVENLGYIKPGAILDKDMRFTSSNMYQGSKFYPGAKNRFCYGTNLNTIYGSFGQTIEDAFVISKSAAAKLQTMQVNQKIINFRQDQRVLNINGGAGEYKLFPDIGEHVREDGAMCAFRPTSWATFVADSDPELLREILPLQDDVIYGTPGALVADMVFNISGGRFNFHPQVMRYVAHHTTCMENIYTAFRKYRSKYHPTNKMVQLAKDALDYMIAHGAKMASLGAITKRNGAKPTIQGADGNDVEYIQAIITTVSPRFVNKGAKISDLHGGSRLKDHPSLN